MLKKQVCFGSPSDLEMWLMKAEEYHRLSGHSADGWAAWYANYLWDELAIDAAHDATADNVPFAGVVSIEELPENGTTHVTHGDCSCVNCKSIVLASTFSKRADQATVDEKVAERNQLVPQAGVATIATTIITTLGVLALAVILTFIGLAWFGPTITIQ